MPSITEPDTSGDVKLSWDPKNPNEVERAKAHFEKLKAAGHIFFRLSPDGGKGDKTSLFHKQDGELIYEFDPEDDVLATKVPVGG